MPYNQITATGTIAPGPEPVGPTGQEIRDLIETTLNSDGFTFSWSARRHQPYEGTLDTGLLLSTYIFMRGESETGDAQICLLKNVFKFNKA